MASADLLQLSLKEEATFGVDPGVSPDYDEIRITGESILPTSTTSRSEEIRSNRKSPGIIRQEVGAAGDINIEFAATVFDNLMEKAIFADATYAGLDNQTITGTANAGSDQILAAAGTPFAGAGFAAGKYVRVKGFTKEQNNGIFEINSVGAGDDDLVVNPSGKLVAGDAAIANVEVAVADTITEGVLFKTFHVQKNFTDAAEPILKFGGMGIGGFSLSGSTGGPFTGSFSFVGQGLTSDTTERGVTAAANTQPMNTVDHLLDVLVDWGDGNFSSISATGFSFNLQNNLRTRVNMGTSLPDSLGVGGIDLDGTVEQYYDTRDGLTDLVNFTARRVVVGVQDNAGNAYAFEFPQVRFGQASGPVAGSRNTDAIMSLSFGVETDATDDYMFKIHRFQ